MPDLYNPDLDFDTNVNQLREALTNLSDPVIDNQIESMADFMQGTGNPFSPDHRVLFASLKYGLISSDDYHALWDCFAVEALADSPIAA